MSTFVAVLAWIGLLVGLAVVASVALLLNRVLRPLREIKRYGDDTLEAGVAIGRNLEGADEIRRTRDLAQALAGAVAEP